MLNMVPNAVVPATVPKVVSPIDTCMLDIAKDSALGPRLLIHVVLHFHGSSAGNRDSTAKFGGRELRAATPTPPRCT